MKSFQLRITSISHWQIFQVIRFCSVIGTNILFTKGLLETSAIGVYESILLIATISSSFWVSGIMQGLLGVFPKNEKSPALFNSFFLLTIIGLVVAIALYITQEQFVNWFNISNTTLFNKLFIWYLVYTTFNNPTYVNEYFWMMTNRNKPLLLYGSLIYFLQFAVLILPLAVGFSLLQSFQLLAVLSICKWIYSWIIIYQHSQVLIEPKFIRILLSKSVPLAAATLISGYAQYIDAWIVKKHFDDATFAAFMYGAREFPLSLIMANALSETLANRIRVNGIHDNLKIIGNEAKKLGLILFPITCLLIVVMPVLFPLIYNHDFTLSASIFNIYLLLIIPRLLFPQSILIGCGKNPIILWSAVIELGINIGCSLLLLNIMGIEGIAWGTVIAYMADKIFLWLYVSKKFQLPLQSVTHLKLWITGSLTVLGFYIVYHQILSTFLL
ncbi:MAG: polysaccharide biosynthesis C-terminal domain-containing protein [Flavobacteriales bacterium]|nr:polysaccharide biosynthesis C-terminal domain-containing protein [Flavobacteriales bacterium]